MQLQKPPTGLLGWFQLKVGGRNPTAFSDTIVPTLEIGDNYLLQGEVAVETGLGTNGAIGTTAAPQMQVTVPAGKLWRILAIGTDLGLAVADNAFDTAVQITFSMQSVSALIAHLSTNGAKSPGNGRYAAFYFPRPFLLTAGNIIVLSQYFSAALTVAASQHYYILRQQIDL